MHLRSLKTLHGVLIAAVCIGCAGLAWAEDAAGSCDYNNDGVVDDIDYAMLQNAFGSVEGEDDFLAAADHDGDGVIAGTDVGYFQRNSN